MKSVTTTVTLSLCLAFFSSVFAAAEPFALEGIALKDSQMTLQGRRVTLRGQEFRLEIPEIHVTPYEDGFNAEVGISKITVYIHHINVRKWLSTDCYHTYLFIGHSSPVFFRARVPVSVNAGTLTIGKVDLAFEIPASNYATSGPQSCRGKWFGKPLMKAIVQRAIANARGQIEQTILDAVKNAVPFYKKIPVKN